MIDSLEISFPLEFVVAGVPVSGQSKSRGREAWKAKISNECRLQLPESAFLAQGPISILIYHFPDGEMMGDIDNIIKPILDALVAVVYIDDRLVERVTAQKFETSRVPPKWSSPSVTLFSAISGQKPLTYVRVSAEPHEDIR
jgi:crossover junction endodeoxyribonuclease RusA